jgi:DNA (cytosine-5)-methyltransferase 1
MNAISLFSGMGGDTLGLENLGINVIAFNDFNKKCIETHLKNFKGKLLHNDILDITKISDETFLNYTGEVNLIFAGFPCQGFSHGGKKLPDDPRNTLFREFIRATKLIRPEFIIGENVEGLLSRETENGEKYIDIIKSSFEEIGYKIKYKVIKAEECGVPQLRRRLIIVGVHELLEYNYEFPEKDNNIIKGLDFIEDTLYGAIEITDHLFDDFLDDKEIINTELENPSGNVHPYITSILNKEPKYNGKTYSSLLSYGKRESPIHLELINYKNPCKTIICTYEHQPRLLVPLRNKNRVFIRPFTINELKQIQGFPKEFEICGNKKEQIIQIGNAVPPKLVQIIAQPLVQFFQQDYYNSRTN